MFEYTICNCADEEIFAKQCIALEKNINGLIKQTLLIDVDGSKIQKYSFIDNEILVINDFFLNEVLIKSQIEIESYFA